VKQQSKTPVPTKCLGVPPKQKADVTPNKSGPLAARVVVSGQRWSQVVDKLVDVHLWLNLLAETLYFTVKIVHLFMCNSAEDIKDDHLEILGLAALLIAAKQEVISSSCLASSAESLKQ
jgi:hypothetical protein